MLGIYYQIAIYKGYATCYRFCMSLWEFHIQHVFMKIGPTW